MKKLLLIIPLLLGAIIALLYSFNNCTEGGVAGNLNECDCVGIKVKKSFANYPDAFEEYACIGLIK